MPLNVEKIKEYLKRFEAMSEEEKRRLRAKMEEDARREQMFYEAEEGMEEWEQRLIYGVQKM